MPGTRFAGTDVRIGICRRKHDHPAPYRRGLHKFELEVRTELTLAETAEPELDAGVLAAEQEGGPERAGFQEVKYEETEHYEAGLRSLLGAIESVEMGISD